MHGRARRTATLVIAALVGALTLGACSSSPSTSPGTGTSTTAPASTSTTSPKALSLIHISFGSLVKWAPRAVSEATALTVAVRVTDSGNGSLPAAPELVSASEESGTTTRDAPASDRPAASELPTLFPATHVSGPAGRWSPAWASAAPPRFIWRVTSPVSPATVNAVRSIGT